MTEVGRTEVGRTTGGRGRTQNERALFEKDGGRYVKSNHKTAEDDDGESLVNQVRDTFQEWFLNLSCCNCKT